MANQEFVVESDRTTAVSEQLMQEIEKMPSFQQKLKKV
jgi:hypothetical protein